MSTGNRGENVEERETGKSVFMSLSYYIVFGTGEPEILNRQIFLHFGGKYRWYYL